MTKQFYRIELPSGANYEAVLDGEAAQRAETLDDCVTLFPAHQSPSDSDLHFLNEWLLQIGCDVARFYGRNVVVSIDSGGLAECWGCYPDGTWSLLVGHD
jgi:hypothetical protein